MKHSPFRPAAIAALTVVVGLSACGGSPETDETSSAPNTLTVISHESFAIPEELQAQFAEETGLEVTYQTLADTGSMVNQLVLTKDSPLGDVVFGIDNTFASRAQQEGVVTDYVSDAVSDDSLVLDGLTPVDYGDVCVNADIAWFDDAGIPVPETLDDLLDPAYEGLLVTPSPASSSPGLAFLFATVGEYGDDWLDYWQALLDSGALVTSGWTEAYNVEFSAGEGGGDYPLVLSYSSSPAFTIGDDGESTTTSLNGTCFRQVEYAGVLEGATNPEGAKAFVDFLLSEEVQASIPDYMYMYPAVEDTELPEDWATFAPLSDAPIELSPEEIDEGREQWIRDWSEATGQ